MFNSDLEFHKLMLRYTLDAGNTLSKCVSHKVGAIIVKNRRIVSTGVNGTPPAFVVNCNDINHTDHSQFHFNYECHAEMNAILFCARHGISTENSIIYCNYQPCQDCTKQLITAGITEIYYNKPYHRVDKEKIQPLVNMLNVYEQISDIKSCV